MREQFAEDDETSHAVCDEDHCGIGKHLTEFESLMQTIGGLLDVEGSTFEEVRREPKDENATPLAGGARQISSRAPPLWRSKCSMPLA